MAMFCYLYCDYSFLSNFILQEAFKTPVVLPSSSQSSLPATATVPTVSVAGVSSPVVPDDATKEEMVKQMAVQSGMNLAWSLK